MRLQPLFVCMAVTLTLAPATAQEGQQGFQVISPIGNWVGPWDDMAGMRIAMTPDGLWIAFVDWNPGPYYSCNKWKQRLSIIRPDGTGRRVILDPQEFENLWPGPPEVNKGTLVQVIAISADARTIAFTWPHFNDNDCGNHFPFHSYLVDIETEDVAEIHPGLAYGISGVTFSDDGERIAYTGWDSAGQHCFVADRTSAVHYDRVTEIVSPGILGFGFSGTLTGDGRRFVFLARASTFSPTWTDVYSLRLTDGALTKLNQKTLVGIKGLGVSRDGSRVVYGANWGPVYAVNGDGTGHRVLAPRGTLPSHTVTRDGEWVFYTDQHPEYPEAYTTFRIRWDGTGQQLLPPFGGPSVLGWVPVNENGSLFAYWPSLPGVGDYPLTVDFLGNRPVMTAYGSFRLGELLSLDVGGPTGSHYILASALGRANIPMSPYGTLRLDPASILRLGTGTILPVEPSTYFPLTNTATQAFVIPNDASLDGLAVHFQALVLDPDTGTGSFTNAPTIQITQ